MTDGNDGANTGAINAPAGLAGIHKKNLIVLATSQTLFTSAASMLVAIGGLVGLALAPDKSMATLPVSAFVVGTALFVLPASLMMRSIGRRAGFMVGALIGLAGALTGYFALAGSSFWFFSLGTMLVGMFAATAQLYRFAATDAVPVNFRANAISLVLLGGLAASFIGPQIAKLSRTVFPDVEFLGSYLSVSGLFIVLLLVLTQLRIPQVAPGGDGSAEGERPLRAIAAQPRFMVAALSCLTGYGTMTYLMTSTPLAMLAHDFGFDDSATVIQWHVFAMFVPSFFTGILIARFGELPVIFAGVLLEAACVAVALDGETFYHFWLALFLLGFGWNFMFVGGSTLLTRTHNVAERAKTQGLSEFLTFSTMALASLSSGWVLHIAGWGQVLWFSLPMLAVAGCAVCALAWFQRRVATEA
ncbi:MAG: MFS transporter [SAR324 cluster bacterium]|nr:MFS transporter [SAR324 cluster bacterium]